MGRHPCLSASRQFLGSVRWKALSDERPCRKDESFREPKTIPADGRKRFKFQKAPAGGQGIALAIILVWRSAENPGLDVPMDVRQPVVAPGVAVRQTFVIQSQ